MSSNVNNEKEKDMASLVSILNTNIDYMKWKEAIQSQVNSEYSTQLAEKCCFQLELLCESLDLPDFQIKKLTEVTFTFK